MGIHVIISIVKLFKNPTHNWVLWSQIFPWPWLKSAWSYLVSVRSDQKQFARSMATGDRAGALWLQPIQSLEYQTDMRRCRLDTLGKSTPANRAGAPTACGRWVSPIFGSPQQEVHPSSGRMSGSLNVPNPFNLYFTSPSLEGSIKCPWAVGGPPAVAIGISDTPNAQGLTHRPQSVEAPARWAGVNFPTGINLAHCPNRT